MSAEDTTPSAETSTAIRVLVADDHPIVVEGLRRHLALLPDIDVVGSASSADEALEELTRSTVDVLICDVQMPGMSGGREVVEALVATGARVLLFTLRPEDALVANLLAGGARGFVSKSEDPEVLVEAIRALHSGQESIPAKLRTMRDELRAPPPHASLTKREYAVFELLARCLTPKEAAFEMGVAASTVYTHADRIRSKLGVSTLAEVAQYARDWSLVE